MHTSFPFGERLMSQPVRSKLFEETVSVTWPLSEIDLDALRRGFARPFDRAAHAVQLAGFEQDDAVIERYLRCRVGDRPPVDVPADSLSDRSRMIENIVTALRRVGHIGDIEGGGDAGDIRGGRPIDVGAFRALQSRRRRPPGNIEHRESARAKARGSEHKNVKCCSESTTRPTHADAQTDIQTNSQAGVQADDVTIVGLRVVAIRESWSTSSSPLAKGGPQGRQ